MSQTTESTPVVRTDRWPAAVGGAVAGAAGVAASELATGLLHRDDSPVTAVAAQVRDLTPGSLAVRLVHLVQHLDKPLLVGGTVVVLLALSAVGGLAYRGNRWLGHLVFGVLAVVGLLAMLARDGSTPGAVLVVLVGWLVWVVLLPLLVHPRPEEPLDRRDFLVRSGAIAGGVVVVGVLARVSRLGRAKVERARQALKLSVSGGTVPAGADLEVERAFPWRTSNRHFYLIDTTLAPPQLTPEDWRLRVHGMVDREITLDFEALTKRDLVERWTTLCCVSNSVGGPLISNAYWSGFLIRDLLAEAGVKAGADAVKQTSVDGWTCGTPLSALTDPSRDALLAVAMNGEPLPIEHGFPVRVVVPGLYGYVSGTKWVVDLEVTRFADFTAYWTDRGWGEKGPIKTESRIDVPRDGQEVRPGTFTIAGVAWAQHTGIAKVEISVDGGQWRTAELGRVPDADTWVQWKLPVDVGEGDHRVRVRATDASGYTQTSARADVLPDGATGWHSVSFHGGYD